MMDKHSLRLSTRDRPFAIMVRYILFAIIAGALNLLTQAVAVGFVPIAPLATSILAGTVVGFGVKYFLDKHWIFFDEYGDVRRELGKVFLYAAFSVAMTLLFWGFELTFFAVGGTSFAKYTGAIIGLSLGTYSKYLLDRNFTFAQRAPARWK